MLETSLFILILVVAVALLFDYINGFNDAANAVATCISTKAMSVRSAIIMAAVLNFVGAIISTKVATTIGKGIVDANSITQLVILAGLCGAVLWQLTTWFFGIPSSSTHALIGGIVGAVIANAGTHALHWNGLNKIILALVLSPIAGIGVGFLFMILLLWICRRYHPQKLNLMFRRLQILSAGIMAFSHGTADAQKSMGIITMALVSYGTLNTFHVPWEVIASCALAISLGTASGGWKIIKTVGKDFVKLEPVHGFCVQSASAGVILGSAIFGLPTSTTHVLTSSILGVGLTKRLSAINWRVAHHIVIAWVLTIPASALVGFLLEKTIQFIASHF